MEHGKFNYLIGIFSNLPSAEKRKVLLDAFGKVYDLTDLEEGDALEFLIINNKRLIEIIDSKRPVNELSLMYLEWLAKYLFAYDYDRKKFIRYDEKVNYIKFVKALINHPDGYLFKKWGIKNIQYIEKGLTLLSRWYFFFFSYTLEGSDSLNEYLTTTQDAFSNENLLAKRIVRLLLSKVSPSRREEDYFYNIEIIKSSGEWERICKEASENSFTLVQLVHDGIFHDIPRKNYAYMEYFSFKSIKDDFLNLGPENTRLHFIIANMEAEDLNGNPYPEYREWQSQMNIKHSTYVSFEKHKLEDLDNKIAGIAKIIKETIVTVFKNYLIQVN